MAESVSMDVEPIALKGVATKFSAEGDGISASAADMIPAQGESGHRAPKSGHEERRGRSWKVAVVLLAVVVAVAAGATAAALVLKSNKQSAAADELPTTSSSGSPRAVAPVTTEALDTPIERSNNIDELFEYAMDMGCLDATLYSTRAPSQEMCGRKCALLRRCAAFVFTESKGTCRLLKSSCQETWPGGGFLTGVKKSVDSDGYIVTVQQTENEPECAPGCPEALLGDGSCDPRCATPECGMDSGDCPSLQDKPELVDIGEPRSSVEIQEQRMNIVMPDAETCHAGSCVVGWVADGECDPSCNNEDCNNDAGDCAREEDRCSDRCPIAWIGDGQCDPECLSEECEFDGQDCDPAPTTTPVPSAEPGQANTDAAGSDPGNAAMVAEDPTEDVDVEEVTEEVQQEAPADPTSVEQPSDWCAPMCHSPNMVGDGNCQEQCNVEACFYDGGDCGERALEDDIPECTVRGTNGFCQEGCPCSRGEGDCDTDAQCGEGLKCKPKSCPNWMSKLTLKDGPQDCCFLPEDCQYTCPEGSYPKYGKNCVNSFEDCQCEEGYTRQIRRETCHWDPSETDPKSEGKSEFSSEQDFRSACMGHGKQFCGPWRWWESECPEECVDVCRSDRGNDRRRNMLSYYDSRQYREWPGAWGIRRALATGYFDQAYLGTGNLRGKFCVAICKSRRYATGCYESHRFMGERFCQYLKCDKFEERTTYIDGCHHEDDYIDLNCKVCKRIFPRCGRR